jgi:hypothetical protein
MGGNPYFTSGNIAELLALKQSLPADKVGDEAYIAKIADSIGVRPQTLAFYWSDAYVPSQKAIAKIPRKEEKLAAKAWLQDYMPSTSAATGEQPTSPSINNATPVVAQSDAQPVKSSSSLPYASSHQTSSSQKKQVSSRSLQRDACLDGFFDSLPTKSTAQEKKIVEVESLDDSLAFAERAAKKLPGYKVRFIFSLRRAYFGLDEDTISEDLKTKNFGSFSSNYLSYELKTKQQLHKVSSVAELYETICSDV